MAYSSSAWAIQLKKALPNGPLVRIGTGPAQTLPKVVSTGYNLSPEKYNVTLIPGGAPVTQKITISSNPLYFGDVTPQFVTDNGTPLPKGISGTFSPATVNLNGNGSASVTLTLKADSTAAQTTSQLVVKGGVAAGGFYLAVKVASSNDIITQLVNSTYSLKSGTSGSFAVRFVYADAFGNATTNLVPQNKWPGLSIVLPGSPQLNPQGNSYGPGPLGTESVNVDAHTSGPSGIVPAKVGPYPIDIYVNGVKTQLTETINVTP